MKYLKAMAKGFNARVLIEFFRLGIRPGLTRHVLPDNTILEF